MENLVKSFIGIFLISKIFLNVKVDGFWGLLAAAIVYTIARRIMVDLSQKIILPDKRIRKVKSKSDAIFILSVTYGARLASICITNVLCSGFLIEGNITYVMGIALVMYTFELITFKLVGV